MNEKTFQSVLENRHSQDSRQADRLERLIFEATQDFIRAHYEMGNNKSDARNHLIDLINNAYQELTE